MDYLEYLKKEKPEFEGFKEMLVKNIFETLYYNHDKPSIDLANEIIINIEKMVNESDIDELKYMIFKYLK